MGDGRRRRDGRRLRRGGTVGRCQRAQKVGPQIFIGLRNADFGELTIDDNGADAEGRTPGLLITDAAASWDTINSGRALIAPRARPRGKRRAQGVG